MRLDIVKLKQLMQERDLSQTELANLSGVSRARINALLKKELPVVHEGTEAKLSKALSLPEGALDERGIENKYTDEVAKRHAYLDFTDLGIVFIDEPMPMEQGFASLNVREKIGKKCNIDQGDEEGRDSHVSKQPKSFTLASALQRSHRFFLLGNPGDGKTTALRYITLNYATNNQSRRSYPSDPLIPVFVHLADLAERLRNNQTVGMLDAAIGQLDITDSAEMSDWLEEQSQSGRMLLLLDGLDEVANPDLRSLVIEKLRLFIEDHLEAHIIISSRIVGFDSPSLGARFDTLTIEPLGDEAIRTFAEEWCAFRHGHKSDKGCRECEKRLQELRHAIVDHPRIRMLAGNPMMLTILLLLHEAGAALPQRRWELYEKIAQAFLFSWQEKKRKDVSGTPDSALKLEDRELVWILESIALKMQLQDMTIVHRWWIAEHCRAFLCDELNCDPDEARSETDALIWSLENRSGLLVEQGTERYGFRHLAFQEYFAARAILAADDSIEAIRPYIYHPRWREVVRLVASELDRHRVPRLLRLILDDPDPTGRFLHRGMLIVLECLADGASVNDKQFIDELERRVSNLGRTKWLGITLDAMKCLAELRSTRLDNFVITSVDKIIDFSEQCLDSKDQFCLFINACELELIDVPDNMEEIKPAQQELVNPVIEIEDEGKFSPITLALRPVQYDHEWEQALIKQLKSDSSRRVRAVSAYELGRFSKRRSSIRRELVKALNREREPNVRAAIVDTLGRATTYPEVRKEILHRLDHDIDVNVRGSCADSLLSVAANDNKVREKLLSLMRSGNEPEIRKGAARGLARCVGNDKAIHELMMNILKDDVEDERVRVACLRSLEKYLPSTSEETEVVVTLLAGLGENKLTRVAAQVLAEYATSGKVNWGKLPIERIEQVLVSIADPCPCALDALRGLINARERRRLGIPREERIKRALSEFEPRIYSMFIFGSSARGDQTLDSDIDIVVIGDVTLKELIPGLKRMEQELGRQVNAVVYSQSEWTERRRERNPFVEQVFEGQKIFVIGGQDELAAMVG